VERLRERFPTFSADVVAQTLREQDGHAGQAASVLREMSTADTRVVDPDDYEHVKTLLTSPMMFKHVCREHFIKFDKNCDGVLNMEEVKVLTSAIYESFGLSMPKEKSVRAFFDANDANHDGVLSEKEFRKFFERFLRYTFVDVGKQRRTKAIDDQGLSPGYPSRRLSRRALDIKRAECLDSNVPRPGSGAALKQVQIELLNEMALLSQDNDSPLPWTRPASRTSLGVQL